MGRSWATVSQDGVVPAWRAAAWKRGSTGLRDELEGEDEWGMLDEVGATIMMAWTDRRRWS
jgi:hypothetical protein